MNRPPHRAGQATAPAAPGSPDTPPTGPDDAPLRAQLRQLRAPQADSLALQQRVLAQWRAQPEAAADLNSAGAPDGSGTLAWRGGPGRPGAGGWRRLGRRGLATLALLALLTALSAWWARPDPALSELLQPDVLSQMGLGEL